MFGMTLMSGLAGVIIRLCEKRGRRDRIVKMVGILDHGGSPVVVDGWDDWGDCCNRFRESLVYYNLTLFVAINIFGLSRVHELHSLYTIMSQPIKVDLF